MSAEPKDYDAVFMFPEGQRVLEDLMAQFAGPPFVTGQPDRTAYNCGTKAVVEFILAKISKAQES